MTAIVNRRVRTGVAGVAVVAALGVCGALVATPAAAATRGYKIVDLAPLAGSTNTVVELIADNGTVTGSAFNSDGYPNAVGWDRHGRATNLGTLPGHTQSHVTAMNSRGDPVGYSNAPAMIADNAVRWDRRGRISPLAPEYDRSEAVDINDNGMIAGQVAEEHAVRWSRTGAVAYLPALPDAPVGRAVGISARGTVAGVVRSVFAGGPQYAVRWHRGGGVEVLDAYPGSQLWWLAGIDDDDRVVGTATTDHGDRVVRWDGAGHVAELALPPGGTSSTVTYVGDRGVVLGLVQTPAGRLAVRWDRAGRPTVLAVPGSVSVHPAAVDDSGVVVGQATRSDGTTSAVRWDRRGTVTALPDGTSAVAINDRGDILGYATTPGTGGHPVVWRAR